MEAIVLGRKDFREYDQLVSFYVREQGKIELLARGVKKIVSKNSAHLEPFSYVFIESVQGKDINLLTNVVPINFFTDIRNDFRKSLAAGFVVSFMDKIIEVGEYDERVFINFLNWLKFVEKDNKMKNILIDGFVMRLLSQLGFTPEIEHCVVCGTAFKDIIKNSLISEKSIKSGFYFSGGGLICQNCRPEKEKIKEKIIDCGLKEVSNLQVILNADWSIINTFEMEKDEEKKLHDLIYEFTLFHTEKKIANWNALL